MKTRIHYAISENPSPSICGRFPERCTRIVEQVTCKDCCRAIKSDLASQAQFKPDAELTATYFNFLPCHNWFDREMLEPFFSCFACQTCGNKLHGNRYYCTATIGKAHTNPREKLEICTDCFQYFFT